MNYKFFIILILIIFSTIGELTTYRVYVDKQLGFFGVQANNSNITNYQNRTIYINLNDTIEWENFVTTDERITIVSDNQLWNDSEGLLAWNYKIFNYTFNKSGKFKVHIRENKYYNPPENTTSNTDLTPWFKYQEYIPTRYMTIIVGSNFSDIPTKIIQKKKNRIIVNNTYNTSIEEPEEEEYFENIIPKTTEKIEKRVSSYQKYTILEFIKNIFGRGKYE